MRGKGKEKTIRIQYASHVQIVISLVLSCISEQPRIWVVCFFVPKGRPVLSDLGLPCFGAFWGIIPPKCRHLRDGKYKTVTQQLGTGSGDPATNWNFKLHVKFVPTWDVARAPGQISPLQQEAPGGPQEAPQSLPVCNTASSHGPCVPGSGSRHPPYFWLCPL